MNLPADAPRASHDPRPTDSRPAEARDTGSGRDSGDGAPRETRERTTPPARAARPPDDLLASRREARWNFRHSEKLRSQAARTRRPLEGDALAADEDAPEPLRATSPPHDRDDGAPGFGHPEPREPARPPGTAAERGSARAAAERDEIRTAGDWEPHRAAPERDAAGASAAEQAEEQEAPFPAAEVDRLRQRWRELQSDFVDDPPASVQDADRLVGDVLNILTAALADQRRALAERGDDAGRDTEELRLTLRAYRSFLERLLRAGG
ncbi:hypothetical protein [Marinactinospora rubrisoli]|uniref:Uncharacterized protein n=1 Tax=Marinactinospora rubrisoli TaxID=2715399 RepID=A0ABW2KGE6_9ACTN